MPQKPNNGGNMQDYIPKGNGDKSGEYTSNAESNNEYEDNHKVDVMHFASKKTISEIIDEALKREKIDEYSDEEIRKQFLKIKLLVEEKYECNYKTRKTIKKDCRIIAYSCNEEIVDKELINKILKKYIDAKKEKEWLKELDNSNLKHSRDKVVFISKIKGRLIWLEEGSIHYNVFGKEEGSGLLHIVNRHLNDFTNHGIKEDDIAWCIKKAINTNKILCKINDYENIYEFEYFGQIKKIHITIGNNGYIVQAHPIGDDSYKRYLKKGEKNER